MANVIKLPFRADSTFQIKGHNHNVMKNSLFTATWTYSANKITKSGNVRLFDGFVAFTVNRGIFIELNCKLNQINLAQTVLTEKLFGQLFLLEMIQQFLQIQFHSIVGQLMTFVRIRIHGENTTGCGT